MNSVDLIQGNKAFFNRTVFQAFAVKTQTYKEARAATQHMKLKFKNCIWAGIAFRIATIEDSYEEIQSLGKKILILMSRMEANNLTIGVGVWMSGLITNHDRNRMVLDRVIDIINSISFWVDKPLIITKTERTENEAVDLDPISSHKYPEFPSRPSPMPEIAIDERYDSLRKRMREITTLIDDVEVKSIHELVNHTIIGKVLEILFCLFNSVPYTPRRAKVFYKKENFVELLKEFDPNHIKKRKIKELQFLLKKNEFLEIGKIEKISHTSVLLMEFFQLINEVLIDVEKPTAKEVVVFESEVVTEHKPLKYRKLAKKKKKEGRFMQVKEMIVNENEEISPVKIAINVRDASIIDLDLDHLKKAKESALTLSRDTSSLKKMFPNKSHDFTPIPIYKKSISSLRSKKNLNNYSMRSIDLHKKNNLLSKVSLKESKVTIGMSKESISNEEEIIDKVLNLNTSRADVSGISESPSDGEMFKRIKDNEIEKQPISVLMKFADILKIRRETHTLL